MRSPPISAAAGVEAETFQFSADEPGAAAKLVEAVVARFGRLDILVNNAGVYLTAPLHELTDEDYATTFDTNVRGPFLTVREASKHLAEGGRIVNIGSINAHVGFPGQTAYAASKAALSSFTGVWAKELGARGITVNTVQPGPIDTDMNPANPDENPMAETIGGMTVLGRYGTADEIAAAVAFFASPDASYVTGAELAVDGGLTA